MIFTQCIVLSVSCRMPMDVLSAKGNLGQNGSSFIPLAGANSFAMLVNEGKVRQQTAPIEILIFVVTK